MRATIGLINFASPIVQRLERDVLPTLAHYPDGQFEIICVDNDAAPCQRLIDCLRGMEVPCRYLWNGGANLQAAASKNQMYALASHPFFVYLCANHGRMYDPTWLEDLLLPFQHPQVAMAGMLDRYPLKHIGEGEGNGIYVQGGVLAARVEVMRRLPMSERFPHDHSDKFISLHLIREGYDLADVTTILSLWRKPIPEKHDYKYVHGEE
ncbi:MAG: hypothetical protein M5U26_24710 [Planctomycetota bacterium]|nr:hypothetical protein [Planctomycetota bacterium]